MRLVGLQEIDQRVPELEHGRVVVFVVARQLEDVLVEAPSLVKVLDEQGDRRDTAHPRVLRVNAIHQDVPFDTTMTAAVDGEIKDLARWLELDLMLPG